MNLPAPSFAGASIATRLLCWFLAISLIPCVVLTAAISSLSRSSVEASVHERLLVISDAKTTQLESFIKERRGDAAVLGQTPTVVAAATELGRLAREGKGDTPEFRRAAEPFRPALAHF